MEFKGSLQCSQNPQLIPTLSKINLLYTLYTFLDRF
jgi:hypothetical protein